MSRYTETVLEDTPCLTVTFTISAEGQPQYGFSLKGGLPLMDLIGYIGKVQRCLDETPSWKFCQGGHECDVQAVVIAWYPAAKKFDWYAHVDVPNDAMCGMLEMIKSTLVEANKARHMAAQQSPILGPDYRPMRRMN